MSNSINCPNCNHEIDVNDVIYHQVEDQFKEQMKQEQLRMKESLAKEQAKIKEQQEALESERAKQEELVKQSVAERIKAERLKLQKELEDEQSERFSSLQEELNAKSQKLKEHNKLLADMERLKREKEELKESMELEAQAKINKAIQEEKEKLQKLADEKSELKLKEREHIIDQLKKQLQEAQRRAEQGSMQLQGEVQELAIEEWLSQEYPADEIEEIKKGARGGDCIQHVNVNLGNTCGTIYYESKRTKAFQPSWIEKFKEDIRLKGANIGVLVTEVLPGDMKRGGLKDGIWICTFEEFKAYSLILRENLIAVATAVSSQENKGDKMHMLYDFLTGSEFRMQVEAIVEGFTQMQDDISKERRAMESSWKRREKQIQKVLLNTNHMYSSIKGIAGNSVQDVKALEFSSVEE